MNAKECLFRNAFLDDVKALAFSYVNDACVVIRNDVITLVELPLITIEDQANWQLQVKDEEVQGDRNVV